MAAEEFAPSCGRSEGGPRPETEGRAALKNTHRGAKQRQLPSVLMTLRQFGRANSNLANIFNGQTRMVALCAFGDGMQWVTYVPTFRLHPPPLSSGFQATTQCMTMKNQEDSSDVADAVMKLN